MRRTGIHTIAFTIRCESGLHIGGSQDELAIGGADNPVIKNPETRKPYIPGSSLKGKMRAELEKQVGTFGPDGTPNDSRPCGCAKKTCPVCRIFGPHMKTKHDLGPSRIIVRDARLLDGGRIENKTENVVNRQRGGAKYPRSNERVAEGSSFAGTIVLQVFDGDLGFQYGGKSGDEALQAVVAEGLRLVQATGLGGGTSRGSGAVNFDDLQMDGQPWTLWSASS